MSTEGAETNDEPPQECSRQITFKDQARETQEGSSDLPMRDGNMVVTTTASAGQEPDAAAAAISGLTGSEDYALHQEASRDPSILLVEAVEVNQQPHTTVGSSEPQVPTTETTNSTVSTQYRWQCLAVMLGTGIIALSSIIGCFATDHCTASTMSRERSIDLSLTPAPTVPATLSPVWNADVGDFANRRQQTDVQLRFNHYDASSNSRLTDDEISDLEAVVGTVIDTYIIGIQNSSYTGFQLQKVEVETDPSIGVVGNVLETHLTVTVFYNSILILDTGSWIRKALSDTTNLLRQLRNVNSRRFQQVHTLLVAVDGRPLDTSPTKGSSVHPILSLPDLIVGFGTLLWCTVDLLL